MNNEPQNLTDLIPGTPVSQPQDTPRAPQQTRPRQSAKYVQPDQAVGERVKITPEMIAESQINKVKEDRDAANADFVSHLKDSLVLQEGYLEAVDAGNLEIVGAGELKTIDPNKFDQDSESAPAAPAASKAVEEDSYEEEEPNFELSDFQAEFDTDEDNESVYEAPLSQAPVNVTEPVAEEETEDEPINTRELKTTTVVSENLYPDLIVKREPKIRPVPRTRNKGGAMNDAAFMNSLKKVMKTTFSSTNIPLPNSGFFVDVQGGGIVDMIQMYKDRLGDTGVVDYTLERLQVFIRSIKSTTPAVDPSIIASMIHENDYPLLALAFVSSTVKNINIPHTCPHCGGDFKIEAAPIDTLLNAEIINEQAVAIRASDSVDNVSILGEDVIYENPYGIKVIIGQPSILDKVNRLDSVLRVTSRQAKEGNRFAANMDMVKMCRSIELPNGDKTSNPYQVYKALSLLDEADLQKVEELIAEKNKDVIIPEFGIRAVNCPLCSNMINDITVGDIDDMVFFHIMVTQF